MEWIGRYKIQGINSSKCNEWVEVQKGDSVHEYVRCREINLKVNTMQVLYSECDGRFKIQGGDSNFKLQQKLKNPIFLAILIIKVKIDY